MGRPLGGYEYSYVFRGGDEILPLYPNQVCIFPKGFLFEIRTNFNLKTRIKKIEKKKSVGSERFAVSFGQQVANYERLQEELTFRLKTDYWMSDHELQSLARQAFDFATRQRAESSFFPLTAVVVDLDVCTVQRDRESARGVARRAIRPEQLIPIYVWPLVPKGTKFDQYGYMSHKTLFWEMPRVRLEHNDETGRVCPVCSQDFTVGDQVYNFSLIPGCCDHACHAHCVFKLFRKECFSCPSCRVQVPSDMDRIAKRLKQGEKAFCFL